jgi:hypothetical protein
MNLPKRCLPVRVGESTDSKQCFIHWSFWASWHTATCQESWARLAKPRARFNHDDVPSYPAQSSRTAGHIVFSVGAVGLFGSVGVCLTAASAAIHAFATAQNAEARV